MTRPHKENSCADCSREPRWSIAPTTRLTSLPRRLALYHDVTSPILSWYRDRGILVPVDAMRSAPQVGREILTALEAMRPLLDHGPARAPLPADLTSLADAFGATGPGPSG